MACLLLIPGWQYPAGYRISMPHCRDFLWRHISRIRLRAEL
jgi:hypothetical protein